MHLLPPLIFIPLDIFDASKPVLVIDTGDLKLESKLTDFDKQQDYKEMSSC